ncbi:MAG: ABC transporter ATP-binding protein [Thermodesulfobacteriota bacterium]
MELKLRDVKFQYASQPVINKVSIEIAESEVAAICGPNGVGKSTLIKCINRILKADGSIRIGDQEVSDMKMVQIARHIGYVPQDIASVFSVTVFEMVLMGRRPHIGWKSSKTDEAFVIGILKLLEIEDIALRDFNELSGGQKQKVILARALAQNPDILLMDEPTSNLDLRHQLEVMELLKSLATEKKISVVMAVHDLNLASRYADKIIMMKEGRIYSAGDAETVLTPDNISSVYGVVAEVKHELGKPYVIPLKHIDREDEKSAE